MPRNEICSMASDLWSAATPAKPLNHGYLSSGVALFVHPRRQHSTHRATPEGEAEDQAWPEPRRVLAHHGLNHQKGDDTNDDTNEVAYKEPPKGVQPAEQAN